MYMEQFERLELLLGSENLEKLIKSHVAVFGVGGVGGYAVEALARSGIGELTLIDNDKVSESNINRQIIATFKTVGRYKADAFKERIFDINPSCKVNAYKVFFGSETQNEFDFSKFDYVVDAIDTVSGKIAIVERAKSAGVPVISSMGAGDKMNPTSFEVDDIYNTSVCPLARVMRTELKKRNISSLKVVYSKEKPLRREEIKTPSGKRISGSNAFVPPAVGLIIASEVVKDLINFKM